MTTQDTKRITENPTADQWIEALALMGELVDNIHEDIDLDSVSHHFLTCLDDMKEFLNNHYAKNYMIPDVDEEEPSE